MNDSSLTPPVADYKDRSGGLIVFGIIEIILGGLCALLIPFMFVGQAMTAQMTGGKPNYSMMIPGLVMYGVLAVIFVWLGIGSMRCRRWARTLTLVVSWSWFLCGIVILGLSVFLLPRFMTSVPDGPAKAVALFMATAMELLMFVLLPGSFVVFYQSKHVKATCDVRDPVPNWTDACPPSVLTLSLCLGFGAVMMLPMLLSNACVLPVFGTLVGGLPGRILYLFMMGLLVYLVWGLYRLKLVAWWITAGAMILLTISSSVTFLRVDMMEMYRMMGYSQEQLEQMREYNFITPKEMVWVAVLCCVVFLGCLLWIKRFFHQSKDFPSQPQ